MILWRLTRERYQALDGEGARLNGGRWNSEGVPVVYLSSTLSLAAIEYLVHIDPGDAPADLVALPVEIPAGAAVEEVEASTLPRDWFSVPDHPACVARGDGWAAARRSLLLRVPSAIVPPESNYLLNPRHPDAVRARVAQAERFSFDPRLLA